MSGPTSSAFPVTAAIVFRGDGVNIPSLWLFSPLAAFGGTAGKQGLSLSLSAVFAGLLTRVQSCSQCTPSPYIIRDLYGVHGEERSRGCLFQRVTGGFRWKSQSNAGFCGCGSPGYHDNHIVIRWFWAAVERFNNEQRLRLLQVRRHWFVFSTHP